MVFAVFGLALPINFTKPLKNYFWETVKPFSIATGATLGRALPFFSGIFNLRKIVKQNSILVSENLGLQSKLAKLSEVNYENEILKKELGFMKSAGNTNHIPCAIIGQSSGYLRSVVIDKGSDNGLKNGDAVISQGYLVGKISDVKKNNSEVTLVTDFNSLIPAVLQDSRGTGLLRGGLNGLSVEDIPLNIEIKKGENVVTSGLGGQIPSGIIIGSATDVISKEGEIFQKVSVESPVDFSKLEVLFVIKND